MRAASTASGASIRGSTAPPRAATRREASGGSATTSTHGEDEHHAAQDRRSRGLASRRARSGRLAEPRRCAYVRHHGAADRPRRRPAGCLVCDVARHAAAQRDGPDVPADERIPFGAVAEADARQIDRGTEAARARFPPCARGEGLDLSGTALMLDAVSARSFRPPAPIPREQRLGLVGLIRALRDNPLETWTAPFFEQLVVAECLPFGRAIAISDPGAIERVLLDNAANYRKDTLQRRIISKGLSNGLLTAEDEQMARAAPHARSAVFAPQDPELRAHDDAGGGYVRRAMEPPRERIDRHGGGDDPRHPGRPSADDLFRRPGARHRAVPLGDANLLRHDRAHRSVRHARTSRHRSTLDAPFGARRPALLRQCRRHHHREPPQAPG